MGRFEDEIKEAYVMNFNNKALENSREDIFSSDKGGTTILVLRTLLRNSDTSAKIVGTSLCNKIVRDDECVKSLEKFKGSLKIILTKSDENIRKKIKNYFLNNLYLNEEMKETDSYLNIEKSAGSIAEFMVLNDKSYLLELTQENNNKLARGNFNNPQEAVYLSNLFDKFYNSIK